MDDLTIKKGKTMAIVSYLTLIGTIIAYFSNKDVKNPYTSFHNRQALGLWLLQMILGFVVSGFDNWNITLAFWILIGVLLFYGVLTAIAGKTQPVPFLGNFFQKTFINF